MRDEKTQRFDKNYPKRFVFAYCSDFRNESNEIFVLWVGCFSLENFDFLTRHFGWTFLISYERYCCLELKLEKIFHL